jgi:hypothetical protein
VSAESLQAALASLGVRGRIETRDRLALLIASDHEAAVLLDEDTRERAVTIAREHGFANVALELRDD